MALACLVSVSLLGVLQPRELLLARNGATDYAIIIAPDCSPSERHGAEELARFLGEMSGATFEVIDHLPSAGPHAILVGESEALSRLGLELDIPSLGREGYVIRTVGERLIIVGGRPRGTMYGCYALLEDYLGCRWWDSKFSTVPRRDPLVIPELDVRVVPKLEYREPFWTDGFDADWAARNRCNSSHARLDATRGGKVTYQGFVHTFYPLLPPEQYFAEHPEYYSEIGGQRTTQWAQLCLTNPDVVRLVAERVKQWFRDNPSADIVSVSQNDWGGWCQCASCREVDDREGSPSGTMISFVNAVAELVEQEFPDKAIDTLAYQYTRHPPKTVRPRPNVIVRLCSIECCFSHPLDTCPVNASFKEDLLGWSKICDRLYVWDYVTNFPNYVAPFPNLWSLGPNVRLYADHSVVGIFEQGAYPPGGGAEFAELRAWVLAKLLWDPTRDGLSLIDEFLNGYYGPAAGPIREWITLTHRRVTDEDIHVNIWSPPTGAHLTDDLLSRGIALFDEAITLAGDDGALRARVEKARLPLIYAAIARWRLPDDAQYAVTDTEAYVAGAEGYHAMVEWFVDVARREGIQELREASGSFEPWEAAARSRYGRTPAVAVESGTLRAFVLPAKCGRIARLLDSATGDELVALPSAHDPRGAGSGGIGLEIGLSTATGQLEITESSPERVVLSGECGPGMVLTERVEASGADSFAVSYELANVGSTEQELAPRLAIALPPGQTGRQVDADPRSGFERVALGRRAGMAYLVAPVVNLAPGESWQGSVTLRAAEGVAGASTGGVGSYCDEWSFFREPELSGKQVAEGAELGVAGYLTGHHTEWAIQWRPPAGMLADGGKYRMRARLKVERTGEEGAAFTAGAYDADDAISRLNAARTAAEVPAGEWFEVDLGELVWGEGTYLWIAPTSNQDNVQRILVDWIELQEAAG